MRSLIASALLAVVASLPCDIFAASGTPCVAAHSMVRSMFQSYNGPLYQVARASDDARLNVYPLKQGGAANASAQDAFCADAECVVTTLFDQTPFNNTLNVSTLCCPTCCGGKGSWMKPANATRFPTSNGGNKVYGLFIDVGMGYRLDKTDGMPVGNESQTIYMVADGQHVNGECCFECVK